MNKGTHGYESLDMMARWLQMFFRSTLVSSGNALFAANKATDPVEKERWMSRHRTLEEMANYIEEAKKYIIARHPELRVKQPKNLIPPELRKGPRLVVDNDEKSPAATGLPDDTA